jgi:ppGpp synthetase/RelA/SpoT-type nucleotidyltranferase
MSTDEWVARYRAERSRYERFTVELCDLLRKLLLHAGIKATIESRTKEVDSFSGKIARPGKSYTNPLSEVTDLTGLRIIVDALSNVDRVAHLLSAEFEIDKTKSVNKADDLEPDRFGYLSLHFIVSLPPARRVLVEWSGLGDCCAEIQVRTTLQHAWSVIQHPFDYKSTVEVPKPLRRRLFRLSALFEVADAEVDKLLTEASELRARYATDAANTPETLPINLDSLRAFIENSAQVVYWNHFVNSIPNTKTENSNWGERDVLMPIKCGLHSIGDYELMLQHSKGWGEKFIEEAYLRMRGSPNMAMSCAKNGTAMYLLIGNYPDILTADLLRSQFGFGKPEPTIVAAKRWNPRFANGKKV